MPRIDTIPQKDGSIESPAMEVVYKAQKVVPVDHDHRDFKGKTNIL